MGDSHAAFILSDIATKRALCSKREGTHCKRGVSYGLDNCNKRNTEGTRR